MHASEGSSLGLDITSARGWMLVYDSFDWCNIKPGTSLPLIMYAKDSCTMLGNSGKNIYLCKDVVYLL